MRLQSADTQIIRFKNNRMTKSKINSHYADVIYELGINVVAHSNYIDGDV